MGLCLSCFYTQDLQELQDVDSSVKLFSFDGYRTLAKVVYIYDGDTVHIVLPLKETKQLVKIKTRLNGIDTPELRIAEQKEKGLESKQRLVELLNETNNIVEVSCGKFDKYGRVLVDLHSSKYTKTLNDILVDEGYAYKYDGGTKRN